MAIRTGQQFIEGLRQPREVYVNGKRITDVTEYPAFRRPIETIASLYDLKHDSRWQNKLTYVSPDTGQLSDISYLIPKTYEELVQKREAYKIYAKATYGTMGRTPDYMNAQLAGLAASAKWFGNREKAFEKNIRNYYKYVRDNDLYLTHAYGTPQTDRSKSSHQFEDIFLHLGVKEETSEGLIVRGAKQLATMGPLTDELLVLPNARAFVKGDERYCLAFAIPVSTPGLKFLCREPLVPDDKRNLYDHPLSSRYEEIDSLVVFDDVLVPWDRVFFYNDLEIANNARANNDSGVYGGHQGVVRAMVKAGIMAAVAIKLTESVKTNIYPQVGEKVGNIIAMLKATEALVYAAELTAEANDEGNLRPNGNFISAYFILYPKFINQMVDFIRQIGGAGLMLTPTLADFLNDEENLFDYYFAGANSTGSTRVQIAKLAWDLVGDSFSQRMQLYEQFYGGEPMFFAASYSKRANVTEWLSLVDDLMEEGRKEFSFVQKRI